MRMTFEIMPSEMRPQDPHKDGTGCSFTTMWHPPRLVTACRAPWATLVRTTPRTMNGWCRSLLAASQLPP